MKILNTLIMVTLHTLSLHRRAVPPYSMTLQNGFFGHSIPEDKRDDDNNVIQKLIHGTSPDDKKSTRYKGTTWPETSDMQQD